ncbi:hypothetical protein [Actinomadura formosensis]|uniref:hypothetical protein n=1 Tax=Actinomadura formosensis TaxID=60706 RepID=UPI0008354B14|nr:hypothetical protein [Actinomadura formosensis]
MTEEFIDQIEFRWDRDYDLTGIATSFRSDVDFRRWNGLLTPYAGISGRGGAAAAEAPSSAVYLTFGDRAALILRCVDPHALRIDSDRGPARGAGAARLDLVARALVGPSSLLTAEVAMGIAATDPRQVFPEPLGQVGRGAPMDPLSFSFLRDRSVSGEEEMRGRAHTVRGLAPLVAAVLADPARPVTLVLPEDEIRSPLRESRALALLWAARRVLKVMLTDASGSTTDGWRATFSTCEAPMSGGDGRQELAIAFRERGLDRPPLNDAPREVRPDDPIAGRGDHLATAAGLLADAYRTYGDSCQKLIWQVVGGCRTLQEKIEAVACSSEITTAIDSEPAPAHRTPPQRPLTQQPPARPAWPRQDPVRQTAAAPVSSVQEPPAPPRRDPYLARLYQMLKETQDGPGALRIMDWIAARTERGGVLDAKGFSSVLRTMGEAGWFADRLDGMADGPHRMADLMRPLFAAGIGDQELEDQLRRRHLNGGLPPVIADALGLLAARLEPDRADWLAERCMEYAVGQSPPDSFSSDAPEPLRRESPVQAVLRLPGRMLPADVAGVLTWLSPVLLVVLLLFMV